MRIINLTRIRRARLITMLEDLIPEYSAVRIERNNLVTRFKRNRFNIFERAYTVSVDSLCLMEIPKRLNIVAKNKELGDYSGFFQNAINAIIYFKNHEEHTDVVDYLWEKYLQISGKDFTVISSNRKRMLVEYENKQISQSVPDTPSTIFNKVVDALFQEPDGYLTKITIKAKINKTMDQIDLFFNKIFNVKLRTIALE